jgi:hypothetical protein
MLDWKERQRAMRLIRAGADLLERSEDTVLIPDFVHIDTGGVRRVEVDAGPYCREKDVAGLIRYLADMMGD